MARKVKIWLIGCVTLSVCFNIWAWSQYLEERSEFSILARAYALRSQYEIASLAHSKALMALRTRRAELLYNLANVTIREALADRGTPKLLSAIEYYKESLRLEPSFVAAKNLDIAEHLLLEVKKKAKDKKGEHKGEYEGKEPDELSQDKLPGLTPYAPDKP